MPRISALPVGRYNQGEQVAILDVGPGFTRAVLVVERISWPTSQGQPRGPVNDSEVMRCYAEVSFDGGTTWPFKVGVGSTGGSFFFRGNLQTTVTRGFAFLQPGLLNRKVRITLDVHRTLESAVHLDVF